MGEEVVVVAVEEEEEKVVVVEAVEEGERGSTNQREFSTETTTRKFLNRCQSAHRREIIKKMTRNGKRSMCC